jgi:lipoate-protein ligase A
MTAPVCRLLPTEALSGPENMAADEVLLLAAADHGIASLRFYTWAEPTLSLGYFQAEAPRRNDPNLADVAWVRRSSGGAAILHHYELTYCLALPAGASWQSRESWLCRFHHAVAAALGSFGVAARTVLCGEEKKLGEFLCFLHQTPGDLLVGQNKVVGSAQRKLRGAQMQHGSILLRQSPHTRSLPGVLELAGVAITGEVLRRAIIAELASATGWDFVAATWSDDDLRHRAEIAHAKYSSVTWNLKR